MMFCETFPNHWKLEYRRIQTPSGFVPTPSQTSWSPDWWDTSKFGTWHDCTLVRAKVPPSMKSESLSTNYHTVLIGFGDTPSNQLGLPAPYDCIYFWRCCNCPATTGSLAMDRHSSSFLCGLSFKHMYQSTARLSRARLLNTVAVGERQGLVILPPVQQSADIPDNIPRRYASTRINNPYYDPALTGGNNHKLSRIA